MNSFDWSIRLGDILTILAMLATGIGAFYALRGKVDALTERIKHVESDLSSFVQALVQLARQDERLSAHDKRLDAIESARPRTKR